MKILTLKQEQQNIYYNPQKSWDGGGYDQPLIEAKGIINGKKFELYHDDTSCGSFGERYSTYIKINGRIAYIKDVNYVDDCIEEEFIFRYPTICKFLISYFNLRA